MLEIRKLLFFVIIISLFLLMISSDTLSSAAGEDQKRQKKTSKSLTSEGYSIFHETMVDMTWQEVEKAAKGGSSLGSGRDESRESSWTSDSGA
ncbi:MAG: hypothetical protein GTO17_06900 [Candidatus Aminicenantes bacterium]|nr:hypothetical protein [Candidatus Aminicenantes bacterium]